MIADGYRTQTGWAIYGPGNVIPWEWSVLAEMTYPKWLLGRWDEVVAATAGFGEEQVNAGGVVLSIFQAAVDVFAQRGDLDSARQMYDLFGRLDGSTDIQDQSTRAAGKASLLRADGRLQDALEAGLASMGAADVLGPTFQGVKHGVIDALEAALALGESAKAEELFAFVDGIPLASRSRYVDAHVQRLRARTSGNAEGLLAAARGFGEIEAPFWAAVARL